MSGLSPALALAIAGVLAPAAAFAQGDTAAGISAAETIAARPDTLQRMTVPVRIGEQGAFRFLLDTGAQNTVVSEELAARLSLPSRGTVPVMGVAGQLRTGVVTLDGLRLGRRNFDGLVAPLFRESDIGADGILGLDSLQRQHVLLDFARGLIVVDDAAEAPESEFEIVVRARRRSGQLIITRASVDGIKVDVVLDTGADSTIGNPALAAALAHQGALRPARLHSVTGQQIEARVGVSRELVLGGLRLGNVPIAYADAPPFAQLGLARRPALLLGMSELRAFRRVAIDFASRKVMFDFEPARAAGNTGAPPAG